MYQALSAPAEAEPPFGYTQNPELKTIKPGWKGTPIDKNKRFVNHEFPFNQNFGSVLKFMFQRNPQKKEKAADTLLPEMINDTSFLNNDADCFIWLGHATFFIRVNGVTFLTDPTFYNVPVVKRYSNHAYSAGLFKNLDYLLITHDHQDHCQQKSIKEIAANNPKMKILAGLGMEKLLKGWVSNEVQMAGWYQQYQTGDKAQVFYLPTRHWGRRSLNDVNKRLWGAFIIKAGGKTLYLGGDTGYGSHFKEARELFPDIDIAALGAGAYKPNWFMSPMHISPQEAVQAFNQLGARIMVPMHYGTFDLSDEPPGEPIRILQAMEKEGNIKGKLLLMNFGQPFTGF